MSLAYITFNQISDPTVHGTIRMIPILYRSISGPMYKLFLLFGATVLIPELTSLISEVHLYFT
jgi:hypothetical protein